MQPSMPLRVASVTSLLLFTGHSVGGLSSWSPPGKTAALDAMKAFQFQVTGFTRSYWHFYVGFGLIISVYLLAQTVLFWQLASWVKVDPVRPRPIIALFLATSVASAILDWLFFFAAPLIMTLAIAGCLGLALLLMRGREASRTSPAI